MKKNEGSLLSFSLANPIRSDRSSRSGQSFSTVLRVLRSENITHREKALRGNDLLKGNEEKYHRVTTKIKELLLQDRGTISYVKQFFHNALQTLNIPFVVLRRMFDLFQNNIGKGTQTFQCEKNINPSTLSCPLSFSLVPHSLIDEQISPEKRRALPKIAPLQRRRREAMGEISSSSHWKLHRFQSVHLRSKLSRSSIQ